jgi:hypothetical protein
MQTTSNYMQTGQMIECGECHPEKFKHCAEMFPDVPCECICHDKKENITFIDCSNGDFMKDDKYLQCARKILKDAGTHYLHGTADCCLATYLLIKDNKENHIHRYEFSHSAKEPDVDGIGGCEYAYIVCGECGDVKKVNVK